VIFYDKSRFAMTWSKPKSRVVLAEFREKSSGDRILVAACHLQGGNHAPTRYNQARSLMKAMDSRMREYAKTPETPTPRSTTSLGPGPWARSNSLTKHQNLTKVHRALGVLVDLDLQKKRRNQGGPQRTFRTKRPRHVSCAVI